MNDLNEAGPFSSAGEQSLNRPTSRSRYLDDRNLDLNKKLVANYKVDQEVYIKGTRGFDYKAPCKIHEVLGEGQYKLSRDGKLLLTDDGKTPKIYMEENLQKKVPETNPEQNLQPKDGNSPKTN